MEGSESRLTGFRSVAGTSRSFASLRMKSLMGLDDRVVRKLGDECVRPYLVRGYNRCFQSLPFTGQETHWHLTRIFRNPAREPEED